MSNSMKGGRMELFCTVSLGVVMETRVLIRVRGRNPPGGVHDEERWPPPPFLKYCSHWSSLRQDRGLPRRKNVRRSEASSFWAASLKKMLTKTAGQIKLYFQKLKTFYYFAEEYLDCTKNEKVVSCNHNMLQNEIFPKTQVLIAT